MGTITLHPVSDSAHEWHIPYQSHWDKVDDEGMLYVSCSEPYNGAIDQYQLTNIDPIEAITNIQLRIRAMRIGSLTPFTGTLFWNTGYLEEKSFSPTTSWSYITQSWDIEDYCCPKIKVDAMFAQLTAPTLGNGQFIFVDKVEVIITTGTYKAVENVDATPAASIKCGETITVTWDYKDSCIYYDVFRSKNGIAGPYLEIADNIQAQSYEDSDTLVIGDYHYRVRIHDAGIYGQMVDPPVSVDLDFPQNVDYTHPYQSDYGKLNFYWDEVMGADQYEIVYNKPGDSGFPNQIFTEDTNKVFDVYFGDWDFKVRACQDDERGLWAGEINLNLYNAPPKATILEYTWLEPPLGNMVILSWQSRPGATGYRLREKIGLSPWLTLWEDDSTSFGPHFVQCEKDYFWNVRASNEYGYSDASNTVWAYRDC